MAFLLSRVYAEGNIVINILNGDVIEKLKELETGSVQCVVTSPPYWGLRDYGTAKWEGGDDNCEHKVGRATRGGLSEMQSKNIGGFGDESIKNGGSCPHCGAKRIDQQLGLEETPEEYVEKMVDVFREVKRVLKDDGTCWLNLGDSYNGSGKAGNKDSEYFKKHTEFGKPAKNRDKIGMPTKVDGLKPKDLVGIPWRVAFALQADGWYLRQDIIWHKPNPMPESVTDRCSKSHEYIFLLTKSAKYFYDNDAIREPLAASTLNDVRIGCKSSRPNSKAHELVKQGVHGSGGIGDPTKTRAELTNLAGRNKRSVWTINTQPYKEAHFAVFPP